MQYLLTEEEMSAIRAEREALRAIPVHGRDLIEGLGNVCKMVATTMIPTPGSAFQSERCPPGEKPHGCVHDANARARYCDRCPVQGICPLRKEWSK